MAGYWAAVLVLALVAPAQAGPEWPEPFVLSQPELPLTAPPDKALLVIAREVFVRHAYQLPENLFLDDAPLSILPQLCYVEATADSGLHCLWGPAGCPYLRLECRPGRTYLLRLREFVEPNDVKVTEWILDDPGSAADLICSRGLSRVNLTKYGVAQLQRRLHGHPRDAGYPSHEAREASAPARLVCEPMWDEHPLDPVNIMREMVGKTGRLTVDSTGVRFVSQMRQVHIPYEQIERVSYTGTRFTGKSPWLGVEYRVAGERRLSCFADARDEYGTATYNRLFAAIRFNWDNWRERGAAAAPQPE
jgi:hypothetical protein